MSKTLRNNISRKNKKSKKNVKKNIKHSSRKTKINKMMGGVNKMSEYFSQIIESIESGNVKELNLNQPLSLQDVIILSNRLSNNLITTTSLIVNPSTEISQKGMLFLIKALISNTTLTILNISDNIIYKNKEIIKVLEEVLKTNKTLKSLDISHTRLVNDGIKAIAKGLQVNTTLTNFNINGNVMGSIGIQAIAEALKVNNSLIELNIGDRAVEVDNEWIDILSQDIEAIAFSAIGGIVNGEIKNSNIKKLDISGLNINDESIIYIANALRNNETLTHLDISDNRFSYNGAEILIDALENNTTLVKLNIKFNQMDRHDNQYIIIKNRLRQILARNIKMSPRSLKLFNTAARSFKKHELGLNIPTNNNLPIDVRNKLADYNERMSTITPTDVNQIHRNNPNLGLIAH